MSRRDRLTQMGMFGGTFHCAPIYEIVYYSQGINILIRCQTTSVVKTERIEISFWHSSNSQSPRDKPYSSKQLGRLCGINSWNKVTYSKMLLFVKKKKKKKKKKILPHYVFQFPFMPVILFPSQKDFFLINTHSFSHTCTRSYVPMCTFTCAYNWLTGTYCPTCSLTGSWCAWLLIGGRWR